MRIIFFALIVTVILAWCVIFSLDTKVNELTRRIAVLWVADSVLLANADLQLQQMKDDSVLQAQYHSYLLYRHANRAQRAKLDRYRKYWDKQ